MIDGSQVLNHLEEQLQSLHSLKDLLEEQDEAVSAEDPQRVLEAVGQLRVQLAARVDLESRREAMLQKWADSLGCLPEEVSASSLAEQDPVNGKRIRSMSAEIHQEAIKVQSLHNLVQSRLRSELSFVSCLVDALYPKNDAGSYSPHKTTKTPTLPRTLDVKS